MNNLDLLPKKEILSLFMTCGFPNVNQSKKIFDEILSHQPHIIEFGLPFSDPMADGPIIQKANELALKSKSDIYLAWPKRNGNNFEFKFCELIESSKLKDNEDNKIKIIEKINSFFEKKISENPSEYFWHHDRWG